MALSLSIDRTSLSLGALVYGNPSTGLWIPEDGVGRPALERRNEYASQARFLHGSTLVASTLDQGSLPVRLYHQAASTAALVAAQDALEAALGQFTYEATLTVDGVATTWTCDPASIGWGDLDSGMAHAFLAEARVVIPVHPVPVS